MFNVIPGNFFTPLSSPNRIVYWDCICRLYSITEGQLAFGVERDVLADELQYYFEQDMAADIVDEDSADTGDAADSETTASETRDSAEFGTGRKIITVENLTTFFRWHEKNSLIIYLGGYPNAARIRLIKSIGESMPDAQLLHFGDIDVGGFEILESLRMKSGMDFRPYRMGVRELTDYRRFAKKLTANDRKRLDMLITSKKNDSACLYMNTLSCMAENGIKLEQECIENSWQEI